jgi:hypothetical protein
MRVLNRTAAIHDNVPTGTSWIRNSFEAALRIADAQADRWELHPWLLIGSSVALYLLTTLARAMRLFWFDEIHTYFISRLPTLRDVWGALLSGVDFNPPAIYLLTRFSQSVLGDSTTATRMPEILLFLVMGVALFLFVKRRCGALYGLATAWFPLISVAYSFSAEARPHALVLGFSALAMLEWQRAAEGGRRAWHLAFMSLSIAGFLFSHCYSVLVLIPFGVAELFRLAIRKKPDWPMWTCIVAPMSVIAVYIPLLQHVHGFTMNSSPFKTGLTLIPHIYSYFFNNLNDEAGKTFWNGTLWPLMLVLFIAGLAKRVTNHDPEPSTTAPGFRIHELIFVGTLALLPIFGQSLAILSKSPFHDRYALSAIIGISALLGFFVFHVTAGNRIVALFMVLLFSSWFTIGFGTWFYRLFVPGASELPVIRLTSVSKSELIVISDPLIFVEAEFYEPPEVARRLRLLTDPGLALKHIGTDMFDRGSYKSHELFPLKGRVEDYQTFLKLNRHFLAYGPFFNQEDWLFRELLHSGAQVKLLEQSNYPATHGLNCMLVDVTTPEP